MKTTRKTIQELLENNDCPLPLRVIPDYMGINLVSVEGISWTKQDDGQLLELAIAFKPVEHKKLNLYLVDEWVPFPTSEYGGLYIFAASNEEQVLRLALEQTDPRHLEECGIIGITQAIKNSTRFIGTTTNYPNPCLVDEHST